MPLDNENDVFTLDKLMRIKRKRGVAKAVVKKKSFVYNDCEYSASEEYLFARHVARIHDKSLEPQDCIFCEFRNIYKSKRHIRRTHNNKVNSISGSSSSFVVNQKSVVYSLIVTLLLFFVYFLLLFTDSLGFFRIFLGHLFQLVNFNFNLLMSDKN